jgi:hypothetical protein
MTHASKTLSPHPFAVLLCMSLSGCAAGSAPQREASRVPAQDAAAPASPESSGTSDTLEESVQAEPAARPVAEKEQPREEAAHDEADLSAEAEDSDAGGVPGSMPKKKLPLPDELRLPEELRLRVLEFEKRFGAEVQSCDGAEPLKDAICSIAERICAMESPSTTKSAECARAQESCEKARKQYQKKCD